ncbi:MAG: hypothetical protein M5U19_23140 [Microthrixaceae bacterium]|nr:hypothetical protein [Microthrixaceae bacterium]
MTNDDVRAALAEVIGVRAVSRDRLPDLLAEAGHRVRTEDVDRLLQVDMAFAELRDGLVYVPALTEGVGFGVWVDPGDRSGGLPPVASSPGRDRVVDRRRPGGSVR